jgi:hypothetical protein
MEPQLATAHVQQQSACRKRSRESVGTDGAANEERSFIVVRRAADSYYSNPPIHHGYYECMVQSAYDTPTVTPMVTPTLPQRTFAAPLQRGSPRLPYEGYPYGGDDGGDKRDESPLFTNLDYLDYISHVASTPATRI